MTEQRGLSRRQFAASEFDASGYSFNQELGTFIATIDCKRWGKNSKLITYMTFEDGRKVVAPTWHRSNYQGLADMKIGSRICVTSGLSSNGISRIRAVELLDNSVTLPNRSEEVKIGL